MDLLLVGAGHPIAPDDFDFPDRQPVVYHRVPGRESSDRVGEFGLGRIPLRKLPSGSTFGVTNPGGFCNRGQHVFSSVLSHGRDGFAELPARPHATYVGLADLGLKLLEILDLVRVERVRDHAVHASSLMG
jgi:hypothetical protein